MEVKIDPSKQEEGMMIREAYHGAGVLLPYVRPRDLGRRFVPQFPAMGGARGVP